MGAVIAVTLSMLWYLAENGEEGAMVEVINVKANYEMLTAENKITVDNLVDFLHARQEKHERELLDAIKECEEGRAEGPYRSVEELMAALDA